MTLRTNLLALACLFACQRGALGDPSGEVSSTSAVNTTTSTVTTTSTTFPGTTTMAESTCADSSDDGGFIPFPDSQRECDLDTQCCEPGFKCVPWGDEWYQRKCTPIAPDAKGPGEPCTVEGEPDSGIDDCELGAMCWWSECVPFCDGSEAAWACEDPCRTCLYGGNVPLCMRICDPVGQDCPEGQASYPINEAFACAPDASGPDMGVYKDPCEFINVCDAGLACISADYVPGCGHSSCCTPICDTGSPNCPDDDLGVECIPWYEGPPPSPCLGPTIGICGVPQP